MPKTRIYGHGVHDFCQEGHERHLLQAKYALPDVHLLVGVISDETHGKQQTNKLLYNELERYESLLHCKHVDEVLIANVPWKIDQPFLDKHKIDFVTITDQHTEKLFIDDPFVQQLIASGKYLKLKSDFISDSKPKQLDDNLIDKIAAFSDEPIAIEKRNKCSYDFNKRISYDQARAMGPERPIRVYADGIYDMFHPGHARQLKQAKLAFPHVHLMVGVVNDELTTRLKGPIVVPEAWRYDRVRHCRYVDEVVRDAPWVIDEAFLIKNKIDFVAHDDKPYILVDKDNKDKCIQDVYHHIKELKMFVATNRMEGISTTDLKVRLEKKFQDC